eukprot:Hpha_TRINITY_DN15900_c0_g10::TRINITY_DN15900_c0_g10_i2::g.73762::m.73762
MKLPAPDGRGRTAPADGRRRRETETQRPASVPAPDAGALAPLTSGDSSSAEGPQNCSFPWAPPVRRRQLRRGAPPPAPVAGVPPEPCKPRRGGATWFQAEVTDLYLGDGTAVLPPPDVAISSQLRSCTGPAETPLVAGRVWMLLDELQQEVAREEAQLALSKRALACYAPFIEPERAPSPVTPISLNWAGARVTGLWLGCHWAKAWGLVAHGFGGVESIEGADRGPMGLGPAPEPLIFHSTAQAAASNTGVPSGASRNFTPALLLVWAIEGLTAVAPEGEDVKSLPAPPGNYTGWVSADGCQYRICDSAVLCPAAVVELSWLTSQTVHSDGGDDVFDLLMEGAQADVADVALEQAQAWADNARWMAQQQAAAQRMLGESDPLQRCLQRREQIGNALLQRRLSVAQSLAEAAAQHALVLWESESRADLGHRVILWRASMARGASIERAETERRCDMTHTERGAFTHLQRLFSVFLSAAPAPPPKPPKSEGAPPKSEGAPPKPDGPSTPDQAVARTPSVHTGTATVVLRSAANFAVTTGDNVSAWSCCLAAQLLLAVVPPAAFASQQRELLGSTFCSLLDRFRDSRAVVTTALAAFSTILSVPPTPEGPRQSPPSSLSSEWSHSILRVLRASAPQRRRGELPELKRSPSILAGRDALALKHDPAGRTVVQQHINPDEELLHAGIPEPYPSEDGRQPDRLVQALTCRLALKAARKTGAHGEAPAGAMDAVLSVVHSSGWSVGVLTEGFRLLRHLLEAMPQERRIRAATEVGKECVQAVERLQRSHLPLARLRPLASALLGCIAAALWRSAASMRHGMVQQGVVDFAEAALRECPQDQTLVARALDVLGLVASSSTLRATMPKTRVVGSIRRAAKSRTFPPATSPTSTSPQGLVKRRAERLLSKLDATL